MLKEFKEFISRGSALDLAIGVVIGAAFGAIVKSFVDDIIMPPIGLLLGRVDFPNRFATLADGPKAPGPYDSLAAAKAAGAVTLNYGVFISAIVSFVLIAFVVFLLVKSINHLRGKQDPTHKDCPHCLTSVPIAATRCPACTSELTEA